MEGVLGILTPDDVPQQPGAIAADPREGAMYIGEPILAVAAVDETTAQDAIEKIKVDLEPLPFTVDPLQSLFPGGPNARSDGNVGLPVPAAFQPRRCRSSSGPRRISRRRAMASCRWARPVEEWSYGDVEAGFKTVEARIDETFVTASISHHSMEPRSCMAYWQNGKCFVHGSSQSHTVHHADASRGSSASSRKTWC